MLGILVQLAISWLLLWLIEKKDLSVLGLRPTKQRALDFFFFFVIAATLYFSGILLRIYFAEERWHLNPDFSFTLFLEGLWWNIKSVLFEELIFRGALLYILLRRIGYWKAIAVSSIAFGIYHWFSFGILGNVGQMIPVFIITGLMGMVYALGYAKTFSLYIPIAIHLGWNFTANFVFSEGKIGNGIFVEQLPIPQVKVSYFIYYLVTLGPLLSAIVINFLLIKRRKQALLAL